MLNFVDLTQDLTLQGAGPYWALTISRGALKFDQITPPLRLRAAGETPALQANTAVWSGSWSNGTRMRVVLTADKCSDDIGPHDYPLIARVQVGAHVYRGCADTTERLNAPETGSPGDAPVIGADSDQ